MSKDETIDVQGATVAAQILSALPAEDRNRLVAAIRETEPEVAKAVEKVLADEEARQTRAIAKTLSQLATRSNREVQRVLRELPVQDIALSVKDVAPETKEKILSNISDARKEAVVEASVELQQASGEQIKAAQHRLAKRLEDAYPELEKVEVSTSKTVRSRKA